MKKILIFSHAMELGGVEKALLGLLETIDTTKYEVDLFLMRHAGELMKYIPESINLLPENPFYADLAVPIMNVIKKGHFKMAYGRYKGKKAAAKRVAQLGLGDNDVDIEYSHKYTLNCVPQVSEKEYDLAVSFLMPHYFVTHKVKAKTKVAWIHTDYSRLETDRDSQLKMYAPYDRIAAISDAASQQFVKIFPELKEKLITVRNILPEKYIRRLTDAADVGREMPEDGSVKLLSIGRFCRAKNFDNVPEICSLILKQNLNVKWYIIGYGSDSELKKVSDNIRRFGVEKNVIVLGKKENPYPYIKACDIYVQPSRYEGRCVSVTEAQLLNKPVVITNYATSASQLNDGTDGIIVPLENADCASGIAELIKDEELRKKLIENTGKTDFSDKDEIKKIYDLIG